MNMKTCGKCKQQKSFDAFCSNKRKKDGLHYYCRACTSEINKTYKKEWRKNGGMKKELDSLESNPIRRVKKRIRTLVSISITKAGYSKKTKAFSILGANFEVVKNHIELKFKPGMNWSNHGEWHIDHVIPLSSAKSEDEIIALNHYTNLQPLWAYENLHKGSKTNYTNS